MRWFIWGLVLPGCLTTLIVVLERFYRKVGYLFLADRGRARFRLRREWLEIAFLDTLDRRDPVERARWEDAVWSDEVLWARDRQSGRLLALVGVDFVEPWTFDPGDTARHATVIFEYARGRWRTEGQWLDAIRPYEAFMTQRSRYQPLALRGRRS